MACLPFIISLPSTDGLLSYAVHQERIKKNKDKRPKKKVQAASKAFLSTLFAP